MTDGFIIGLSIGLTIFVIVSITTFIVRRKKAKRGAGRVFQAPVVVTSATHTAPGVYPTGMQTVAVYPTSSGSNYQQTAYPQQPPYPVSGGQIGMPMPQGPMQPMGINQPMMAPYPVAGPGMNPPSYESAVHPNSAAAPNPNQPGYEKQSPYNPNYSTAY